MNQGMKLLDRGKLEAAYITYSTIFDQELVNTKVIYPEIATVISNAGPVNQFNWLGDVPTMQKWLGMRIINRLRAEKHTLVTDWYANGIELDYDDLAEDKLGIVRPRIADLAKMGPKKIDAITIDMYTNGFGGTLGTTYDGQYLFDVDHTADGAGQGVSQSNYAGAVPLTSASYNAAIAQMMGFVGTNGEPLEITPKTILVGIGNQLAVRQLLQAQYGAAGATNVDAGTSQAIVNARIAGAKKNYWFLIATDHSVRPVLVGVEVPPMFAELSGWEQYHVFMHRAIMAGAHMKVGFAYGMWQCAIGANPP